MWDTGNILKKPFSQPSQYPGDKRATAMDMGQKQSPGAVPAGFSSARMQGEEDEDQAMEEATPSL